MNKFQLNLDDLEKFQEIHRTILPKRKKDLDQLIAKYRGKHSYDCIVPFSGGKDSTFTLYYLIKK